MLFQCDSNLGKDFILSVVRQMLEKILENNPEGKVVPIIIHVDQKPPELTNDFLRRAGTLNGERLKALLKSRHMTQGKLVEKINQRLNTKTTQSAVSKWILEHADPNNKVLAAIAAEFEVTVASLLHLDA